MWHHSSLILLQFSYQLGHGVHYPSNNIIAPSMLFFNIVINYLVRLTEYWLIMYLLLCSFLTCIQLPNKLNITRKLLIPAEMFLPGWTVFACGVWLDFLSIGLHMHSVISVRPGHIQLNQITPSRVVWTVNSIYTNFLRILLQWIKEYLVDIILVSQRVCTVSCNSPPYGPIVKFHSDICGKMLLSVAITNTAC